MSWLRPGLDRPGEDGWSGLRSLTLGGDWLRPGLDRPGEDDWSGLRSLALGGWTGLLLLLPLATGTASDLRGKESGL